MFGPDNFKVILVNSHSDNKTCSILEKFKVLPWVSLCNSKVEGSLKDALWTGWISRDKTFKANVVHITETDGLPNLKTFKRMLYIYFEEESKRVGSVSPMYSWHGRHCYPTNSHWITDPIYKKHPTYGTIRTVGKPGVPLLYSLWRPNLLQSINTQSFPPFIHLDTHFGEYVHKLGYTHLRVTASSIDHDGGGRKSRSQPQRQNIVSSRKLRIKNKR